jgi:hypothetical protein
MAKQQKGFSVIELLLVGSIMLVLVNFVLPNIPGFTAAAKASGGPELSAADDPQRAYVARLMAMANTPYLSAPCSNFICQAKKRAQCYAADMWSGCKGEMTIEQEAENFNSIDTTQLRAGDIVNFHGIHVAAYLGNGLWMDSVPERGVGQMQTPPNPADPWYSGKVRILRWGK